MILWFFLLVLATVILVIEINIVNSTVPFNLLVHRNKRVINNEGSVPSYLLTHRSKGKTNIKDKGIKNKSVPLNLLTLTSKEDIKIQGNSIKYGRISTLARNTQNVNLTKPWFTILDIDKHVRSFKHFFTKKETRVTTLPSTYKLDVGINCQNTKTELLILIPSVVNNTKTRQDIRATWASSVYDFKMKQNDIVKLAFFFGDSGLNSTEKDTLKTESNKFDDIVTIDMVDSYKNLSLKVASMLQWSVNRCPSTKFVAKIDMDSWVNIPLLINLLKNLTDFNRDNKISASVLGYRYYMDAPPVMRDGKWKIPVSLYPYNSLPRYLYGHSYVLSRKAADDIVSSLPHFPIIPNEDAFITGIMSLVANVTRIHNPSFANCFRKDRSYKDVRYNRLLSSLHSKNNLIELWNRATDEKLPLAKSEPSEICSKV